ncbi:DUF2569 domain-containing protein [Kosakonia sp. BK9b]|uniref:hypothetical protein n=1 Tax=Kosakonia sp. TaxID=1916651 RepID=UPI002899F8CA|nr:hypothetical protein [Kosakonia sp.]
MNLKNKIFVFWGIMDALALVSYLFFSLQSGKVPFYSDIHGFYSNYAQMGVGGLMGGIIQVMFFINILMIVSLVFSGWWLLVKKDIPNSLFIVQEIARVVSLKCSLTIIPLFMHLTGSRATWLAILLFIFSEAIKIASIVWAKRQDRPGTAPAAMD